MKKINVCMACVGLFFLLTLSVNARVTVTVKPIHSLVTSLTKDTRIKTYLLINGTDSPHTFFLKPSRIRRIYGSTLFVYVDEVYLESSLAKIIKNLPDTVSTIKIRDYIKPGPKEKRHPPEDDDGHGHPPEDDDGHGHSPGEPDPHVWLDVKNAQIISLKLAKELRRLFPKETKTITANEANLLQSLETLDTTIKQTIGEAKKAPFVVWHDAYKYYERAYGISESGVLYANPSVPMSIAKYQRINDRMTAKKITCLFTEPQFDNRLIDNMADRLGLTVFTLDPIGAKIPEGPEFYKTHMMSLTQSFLSCFSKGK